MHSTFVTLIDAEISLDRLTGAAYQRDQQRAPIREKRNEVAGERG